VLSQSVDNTTVAEIEKAARVRTGIDGQLDVTSAEEIYSFEFAQTGGDSGKIGVAGSLSYVYHASETAAHLASGVVVVGGPLNV
jgi:hypothetical protein